MCSITEVLGGPYLALRPDARVEVRLPVVRRLLAGNGPVPVTAGVKLPRIYQVAVVAIVGVVAVAVGYPVINQRSVLVLAELAD